MHRQELKRKVHSMLLVGVIGMILLYGIYVMRASIGSFLIFFINEQAIEQAQRRYFPGVLYQEREEIDSVEAWLFSRAEQMIPLGSFLEESQSLSTEVEDKRTYQMILKQQEKDDTSVVKKKSVSIDVSMEKLKDFDYLISNFYTVDSSTMIREDELNGEELMKKDLKIDQETDGPKVLVYHTHSQEAFKDSKAGDVSTTIVGMGEYLTQLLNQTYGIETIHHTGVYDLIDGKLDRSKAYDLAKPDIQQILEENPTIEVVIDLHRDGVGEKTHLATEVNGESTAQIMFFNGLSKTRANGEIDYLANPYIQDNLAFSLQMQIAANEMYPGVARRIYLRGYRYNMHFKPKTLLVEAGAQTNTVQEMRNAMEVLADILDTVLVSGK